ncbi:Hypothetical predicted protein [Olea europaea subsp. europaea]|uniref:Uncharacterized protein n=1 Tax=Olea europaea subsp. europaea TaxID=158383 RepID=A0A8S0Q751_OLEEU|nr:Hypothetical predicted protein [Olea europaea subsp. europaea]
MNNPHDALQNVVLHFVIEKEKILAAVGSDPAVEGESFKLPHHSIGFAFDGFIKLQGKKPKRRIRGLRDGNLQDIGTPLPMYA